MATLEGFCDFLLPWRDVVAMGRVVGRAQGDGSDWDGGSCWSVALTGSIDGRLPAVFEGACFIIPQLTILWANCRRTM